MNITALKYFKEIIEAKSISKVAQNSHISQSALSQIIQKLEAELGYQLLNRSNKGVTPTEMGRIVYKYSGIIARIHDKMKDELHFRKQRLISVRINGYSSFINYSLPCIMYKIKKKFPMYKFELHSRTSKESYSDLIDEVTDFAFVSVEPCDDRIKYDLIGKEKFVLVASKDSKIPETIKIDELIKYELVLLYNQYAINQLIEKKLRILNLSMDDMNIMFEVDTIAAAKSSVRNNLGVSFLPYMSVKKELYQNEFKVINIEGVDLEYNMYIASRKDLEESDALEDIKKYFIKSGTSEFC